MLKICKGVWESFHLAKQLRDRLLKSLEPLDHAIESELPRLLSKPPVDTTFSSENNVSGHA